MEFIIEGVEGKQRPRARILNGHAIIYTPNDTKKYEKKVAEAYINAGGTEYEKEIPLKVTLVIYHGVPKSTSKKKRAIMLDQGTRPMKKADVDNICKIVLDGLNGIAYKDDTQVVELSARKYWAETDYIKVKITDATL